MSKYLSLLLFITLVLTGCSSGGTKYRIGVSQCSGGYWRDKLNAEMQRELLLHDSITMEVLTAYDNDSKQIADIQHFIDEKVDIIIASPNMEQPLTEIVTKAYKAGIPVLLFDRYINGDAYTAYVGGDNIGVGRQLGHFAISHLPHGGNVIELKGNMETSPARQRHSGFADEIAGYTDINVLASVDARWDGPIARRVTDSLSRVYPDIDVIVAHSDFMASAAKASMDSLRPGHHIKFIGADGFGSPGLGIFAVEKGNIDATAMYPTGGDVIIQTALDILEGRPYKKEKLLPSHTVSDPKDAELLVMLDGEINHEVGTIVQLRDKVSFYVHQLSLERTVLLTAIIILILIITLLVTFIRMRTIVRKKEHVIQKKEEEIEHKEEEIHKKEEEITNIKERLNIMSELDREFIYKLGVIMEENIPNPDFSVEIMSHMMCLSRAQLYRKCKALTGETPVEYIRNSRLKLSRQLLETSSLSVTEVSKQVGFADAAYFSRCFKVYFGMNPSEIG